MTLGEELRTWKFLLDSRFEGVQDGVDGVGEWFRVEKEA